MPHVGTFVVAPIPRVPINVLFSASIIMIESDFYDGNEFHPFTIAMRAATASTITHNSTIIICNVVLTSSMRSTIRNEQYKKDTIYMWHKFSQVQENKIKKRYAIQVELLRFKNCVRFPFLHVRFDFESNDMIKAWSHLSSS